MKRKGGSTRREQNNGGSGREGCRKLDLETAFAGMSERPDSYSPRESGGKLGFRRECTPMAVVEATSR